MRIALTALIGALALGPVSPSGQSPSPPQGDNVLVGRVLETGSDEPVPGAVVSLIGYLEPDGPIADTFPRAGTTEFFAPSVEQRVLTSAEGVFVFRGLPPGRYNINALAMGYEPPDFRMRPVDLDDSNAPTAVTLRLWRLASVSGRVFDERGEPVVGATVNVLRQLSGGRSPTVRSAFYGDGTVTDDRGAYRLGGLTPGRYLVGVVSSPTTLPPGLGAEIDGTQRFIGTPAWLAMRDGGASGIRSGAGMATAGVVVHESGLPPVLSADGSLLTYPTTLYPGTTDAMAAELVTLDSGDDRAGIDIPVVFSRTVSVSGVLMGPEGPVHSVKVQLQQSADGMLVSDALSSASAVTDAAGRFVLLGVSPGSYVLNAVRLTPGAESEDAADAMTLWASAPVSVGEQDVRGLAIALQPGTRILGQVDFGAVSTSPLVEGLRVNLNLRPFGGGAGTYRGAFTNVRADGSFASLGMPPGRYQISASIGCPSRNPCPNEWQLQAVTLGGTLLPYDVVDVADADLSGLVLHFSERSAAVSGSIVDANGSPSAADAIIFPADTNLWQYDVVNRRVRVEHARPDGGFWIDRLGPGDYYVVAVDPPFSYMDPVAYDRLVPGATRITLGEGEQATLRLETYTPGTRPNLKVRPSRTYPIAGHP